ncbi:SDR family oxidoreductase [Myxococcota bacterium]|nr:SDR family oxidoreductase [Myxococcota bacterium]
MRLEGRTAIITGGAGGIGFAYAQRFANEGARVAIADVDEAAGQAAAERLGAPGEGFFVQTDVSDPESVEACANAVAERYGSIDILVNNAALYGDWDMRDQSFEYLQRVFEVNQHGVWLMTRAVSSRMVEQRHGRIINQASGAAFNYASPPSPDGEFHGLSSFSYSQTKFGVVGLTKFSAAQLGRYGVTVNCIAPGVVDTEATRKTVPGNLLEQLGQDQPIPGVIQAEDLTGAAVFFASDEARYITGQILVVSGGRHMP